MKNSNHVRYLRKKRQKATIRRLLISAFFLGILFLVIKIKDNMETKTTNQPEIVESPNSNKVYKKEKPKIARGNDEEVFRKILKTENIYMHTYQKNELLHNLEIFAKYNKNAKLIMKNADNIEYALLKLAGNNYTAINFVAKTIDKSIQNTYTYPTSVNSTKVPLYLQWDKRWGYEKYSTGIIGYTGCGPTSCAMVVSALKNDPKITPAKIAEISEKNGFVNSEGTSWGLYPYIANKYGLKIQQTSPSYDTIKKAINNNKVIIISVRRGDFTQYGHVMVISGIDKNGKIKINDPNNLVNSITSWDYERLKPQIKAMWVFSNGE